MQNHHPYQTVLNSTGTSLSPSDWYLIDQSRIQAFADATDDQQYIHTDPARAAKTELGGTIAHGLLSLSLLPRLAGSTLLIPEGMTMGINYGFNKVRFLSPVRPGDQVRTQGRVVAVKEKSPGRLLVTTEVVLEIQGQDKPALVCEWLNLLVAPAV